MALKAWWKLNVDAKDSSGNEKHGTINISPTIIDGLVWQAMNFDGIDDTITLPTESMLTGSITFRFKYSATKDMYIYNRALS